MPDVIVNTSPLQYLFQLGLLDLLPAFYGRVLIPLEVSAPTPAGLAEPAFAAPAPIASGEPGEPARSLDSLSAAKRKLLAKRIRGER